MFKKGSSTDDQCTSRGFNIQDGQNFFPDIRNNQYQFNRLNKLDDEGRNSIQYLPRMYYHSNSKNSFEVGTRHHFQDLNEKFHELECKMSEVEKCFKEANEREMDEAQRLLDNNDMKSASEIVHNMQKSRLYEVPENRKETSVVHPSNGIGGCFGDHHSTVIEKQQFHNSVIRDGNGDVLQLPSEGLSEDSGKTLTKSIEKSAVLPINSRGNKGIFTINHFDEGQLHQSSRKYSREEKDNSNDVNFLEKSKKLILTLIDKELKKIETRPKFPLHTNQTTVKSDASFDAKKNLKIECINNIERELMTLKKLELLEQ